MSGISLTMDFSMLFSNVHCTAFVLGMVLYLGYMMLPFLRPLLNPLCQIAVSVQRPKAEESDASVSPKAADSLARRQSDTCGRWVGRFSSTRAAVIGGILSLAAALAVSAGFIDLTGSCPAEWEGSLLPAVEPVATPRPAAAGGDWRWRNEVNDSPGVKFRGGGAWKFMRHGSLPKPEVVPPTTLLSRAQAALVAENGQNDAWPLLEACVEWSPVSEGGTDTDVAASELRAQLECHSKLVESGAVTREASPKLLATARRIVGEIRARDAEARDALDSVDVEWARIAHGVFQLSCKAVVAELREASQFVRGSGGGAVSTAAVQSLSAFLSLERLESPLKEVLSALGTARQVLDRRLQRDEKNASMQLQDVRDALDSDRACSLQALQEGRALASVLPKKVAAIRTATQCRPRMFKELEAFVVEEAAKATDGAAMFGLGLYLSDIGLSAGHGQTHVPLFGAGPRALRTSWMWGSSWSVDAEGFHAPAMLVEAEALMLKGEEASAGPDQSDRGAARALRLYQHAKMLALKHHDDAAEWRYREAAKLAATHRRQKLAAHSLARLGYFLSLRGRKPEALGVIDTALTHSEDPLARYLQASLRRSLGELRNSEVIETAEKHLSLAAGQLPSKILEELRAAAHAELRWWRLVRDEGLHMCYRAWDAAQFLICILCGVFFKKSGNTTEEHH